MNKTNYDTLLIGSDPNALIVAAQLSANGQRVLLLERRDQLGAICSENSEIAGYKAPVISPNLNMLRSEVLDALGLSSDTVRFIESPVTAFLPNRQGKSITLWRDLERSVASIAQHSPADAQAYSNFAVEIENLRTQLEPHLQRRHNELSLGALFLNHPELARTATLPLFEYLNHWFGNDRLKGALGTLGVTGMLRGPRAQGTLLHLLYQTSSAGLFAVRYVAGGLSQLSAQLAQVATQCGAVIRTNSSVERVLLEDERAIGVLLKSGEEIFATQIISSLDARQTLFGLVGAPNLEPSVVRRLRSLKYRGCTAQINLCLSGLPEFIGAEDAQQFSGHIVIAPDLDYVERAYDAAKYGDFSPQPVLDILIPTLLDPTLAPPGKHLMTVTMHYASYALRGKHWNDLRESLGDTVIKTLRHYAPEIDRYIDDRRIITPLDYEEQYDLTEGSLTQSEMSVEQMFALRPIPGWSDSCTPIENLWLCGAATHPGGVVTGLPGWLTAQEMTR
ncbi:MAG: NAD(P)/FAD-dependent oxidoreductase [Caldilineaceae bacterium]